MVEGSSGVKLPTTWTNRKVEVGRFREEKGRRKKIRKEKEPEEKKCRRAKMVGKSRNTVFPMFCGPRGSKSRLAKAAGAKPSGRTRDQKLHATVTQSTF